MQCDAVAIFELPASGGGLEEPAEISLRRWGVLLLLLLLLIIIMMMIRVMRVITHDC